MSVVLSRLWLLGVALAFGQLPLRAGLFLVAAPADTNAPASSASLSIGWNPSPTSDAAGYFLCYGFASGACTNRLDVGNVTSVTIGGVETNVTYYFTVVTYDGTGTESLPSNQIEYAPPATPAVIWPTPADLVYGTALGAAQLNASSPVPGTFTYIPLAGTVLSVGDNQTLSVTFTPTNTQTYLSVTTNVSLNVLKKALTITAMSTNKVYGAALPGLRASYSGFVNGDTTNNLTAQAVLSTTATAASPAGNYPITVSGASSPNYTIGFVAGTLTVNAATLTITAVSTNKVYGAALPGLRASYSGFVNGDTTNNLTAQAVLSTTATAASPAGNYPITVSGASSPNYTIGFVAGTLTVNAATLTITAVSTNKVYGAALPGLRASYSGFVNGDTTNNLTAQAVLSTTATAASPAGNYPITVSGASSPNYTIGFVAGTLTVNAATLTITAVSTNKVYGSALILDGTAFTLSAGTLFDGDTLTNVTLFSAGTASNAPAGSYPIVASAAQGVGIGNYTIVYTNGTLMVTPAATTGSLTASANPTLPGSLVSFTLALSAVPPGAGAPTGTVQFKIDGANAGSPVALSEGGASYATSTLSVGTHAVTAEYDGEESFIDTTNRLAPDLLINTPPVAEADTIERDSTNSVKVAVATLLSNDTDADGHAITFQGLSASSVNGGTVVSNGGWVCYTPAVGFTGTDTFTYTIGDGFGVPVTGTVTVNVRLDSGPSPALTIISLGGGAYTIRGDGIPDRTYRVQSAYDPNGANWQTLGTATADSSGVFEFLDNSGSPQRFYRSVYP